MKRNLLSQGIFFCLLFTSLTSSAQTDRFAYAITDMKKDGANWSFLRKIDLNTGAFSEVILNGSDEATVAYDEASRKPLSQPFSDERFGKHANAPFATGVAAIAYDRKNQRIYYTPMFINQLRYIDLKTMKVYFVFTPEMEGLTVKASDQSNIITRMTIGPDGNGYALTNDANHLLRFTTGKKITITDLGAITDHPSNNQVSVHNACISYGGDMVADDDGNLYLFSNRTNIFKINIESKVAIHMGAVSGLPPTFTVNGAAVDDNNSILITSAADDKAMYTVDSKTWVAKPAQSLGGWRTADLANSNLLSVRKAVPFVRLLPGNDEVDDGRVQVYPNPITNDQFTVQFNTEGGKYRVEVKDALGRQVTQTQAAMLGKGQTRTVNLPSATTKGFYLVKVIDEHNKTVYSKKVLVLEN